MLPISLRLPAPCRRFFMQYKMPEFVSQREPLACKSCSFWADNFDPIIVHLNHRDTSMAAISRAPYPQLEEYEKRKGWSLA